ncbi:hypothetical protein [Dickeya fangzhongdai]|uniref:hypothetical protein n=1 Tax=Dickeya fangzhongdai TaxID=1778540 RepID=UPI001ADC9698|nr:hypothetical protein [Dickeya fangzhongdai]MBO8135829.1 hypothetical protein [Dickeya fangzhongdai]
MGLLAGVTELMNDAPVIIMQCGCCLPYVKQNKHDLCNSGIFYVKRKNILEEKDKDTLKKSASKEEGVNEVKDERVNTLTDNLKRRPGCNRKTCFCAR